jgi:hypothetical protein
LLFTAEIEEELAPLTEALEPPAIETYDDQLILAKHAAADLSWIHALGLLYFETNNWASSKSRAFFFSSQSKENS